METRHNFRVLGLIRPPLTTSKKIKYCINIEYKSLRNFSKRIGISHTTLNAWMSDPAKYPEAHQKIIRVLGFDPDRESGLLDGE